MRGLCDRDVVLWTRDAYYGENLKSNVVYNNEKLHLLTISIDVLLFD